jgi:lysine biosynthesis protein LysW
MQNTKCPLCNSDIIIEEEAYEGDLVNCINCDAELEISSLHPLNLTLLDGDAEKESGNEGEENFSESDDDAGADNTDEE